MSTTAVALSRAELERFTQGQCHALALAASALLINHAVPHRIAALYLDPALTIADAAVGDVDAELGTGATAANTQHVFIVRDTDAAAFDVAGWCPSLNAFMNYAYDGVFGFTGVDDPMLRYAWVDRQWVHDLARHGWQAPDLDVAAPAAAAALTRTNPWPDPPDTVD